MLKDSYIRWGKCSSFYIEGTAYAHNSKLLKKIIEMEVWGRWRPLLKPKKTWKRNSAAENPFPAAGWNKIPEIYSKDYARVTSPMSAAGDCTSNAGVRLWSPVRELGLQAAQCTKTQKIPKTMGKQPGQWDAGSSDSPDLTSRAHHLFLCQGLWCLTVILVSLAALQLTD